MSERGEDWTLYRLYYSPVFEPWGVAAAVQVQHRSKMMMVVELCWCRYEDLARRRQQSYDSMTLMASSFELRRVFSIFFSLKVVDMNE